MIGFYATANPSFASESDSESRIKKYQDYSYALIQRTAWDEYTKEVAPVSATMAL
ncbi:hypothetical protein FACS1894218_6280 [Bacilli bacterium]|nr:hypothetical protein FACS1894218_6280 [Bacilli bacterium]